MATRDMSEKQFKAALKRYGFSDVGYFGYVRLPPPSTTSVSILNAGERHRDQLAWLLQEAKHDSERREKEAAPVAAPRPVAQP